MIKNIIFDLDGTLINTEVIYKAAMIENARNYHVQLSEEYAKKQMGKSVSVKTKIIVDEFNVNVSYQMFADSWRKLQYAKIDEIGSGIVFNDVETNLIKLKQAGYKIYLATNSRKPHCDILLKYTPIEKYLDGIVYGDDVRNPKPASDIYLKVINDFKLNIKECVGIEDSNVGLQSCYGSGIKTIGIERSEKISDHYHYKISSLNELMELIERIDKDEI